MAANNLGMNGSTATTTLTAKMNISNLTISYSYVTEQNCDKFTLTAAGNTILNAVSGTQSGSWTGSISAGQSISLTYTKDSSLSASGENVSVTLQVPESTSVMSRTINKIYIGASNLAHQVKRAYIGVGGLAKLWWKSPPSFNGTIAISGTSMNRYWGQLIWTTPNHAFWPCYGNWVVLNKNETVSSLSVEPADAGYSNYYWSERCPAASSTGSYIIGATFCSRDDVGRNSARYPYAIDDNLVVHSVDKSTMSTIEAPLGLYYDNLNCAVFVAGYSNTYSAIVKYDNNLVLTYAHDLWGGDDYFSALQIGDYAVRQGNADSYYRPYNVRTLVKVSAQYMPVRSAVMPNYVKPNGNVLISPFESGTVCNSAIKMDTNLTITTGLAAPVYNLEDYTGYSSVSCDAVLDGKIYYFYSGVILTDEDNVKHPVFSYTTDGVLEEYAETIDQISGNSVNTVYRCEQFNGKIYIPSVSTRTLYKFS